MTAHFDQVVDALEQRARLMLGQWALLGTSHIRFTGKSRIGDDELRDRFARLHSALQVLPMRLDDLRDDARTVAPSIFEAIEALTYHRFSLLSENEVGVRLERAWAALTDAVERIAASSERTAEIVGEGLQLLTPAELRALAEDGEHGDPEALYQLGRAVALLDDVNRAMAEARMLFVGRFGGPGGRGAPERVRGRRLAAHLLGMAEALGLHPTRNHQPDEGSPKHSAADAVVEALRRCRDMPGPVIRAILAEAPSTFAAVVRKLIPACKPERGDPVLISERAEGFRRARSLAHARRAFPPAD